MQKLVIEYLNEWKKKQKKRRRVGIVALLLVVMVAGGIISVLTEAGIAMTGDVKCEKEEHQHVGECYERALACGQEEAEGHQHAEACYQTESVLICGQEESEEHPHTEECYSATQTLICGQEESVGHIHSDDCHQEQLVCEQEEHSHSEICYIDENAGVEDASVWDAQYAGTQWKDVWNEDLVTAARKQLGYEENTDNYTVTEDGSHKGYTRYGQFAGNGYMDWDAAFVNFCVSYAGLAESALFPGETNSAGWAEEFAKLGAENGACLVGKEDYTPKAGDIIFFHREQEETEAQMGIVSSYNKESDEIQVIEGNSGNMVKENTYSAKDDKITNYLNVAKLEASYKNIETEAVVVSEEDEESHPEETEQGLEGVNRTDEAGEADKKQTEDEDGEQLENDAAEKVISENGEETDAYAADKKRTAENAEGVMGLDEAYVNSIRINSITTGTAPFDEEEGRGNDTSAEDRIVRTYDTVTYNFEVNMKPWEEGETYKEARVKLEFVLPRTEAEADFDQSAMAWMDTAEGYEPKLTTETRMIDGKETECQVLTCYKLLRPASGNISVIPGNFGENLTIYVKSMHEGDTFAPIISAAMEGGTWDGECGNEEHIVDGKPAIEKKTVEAEPVRVTAAPKYNIRLQSESSYRDVFEFQGDEDWMQQYGEKAANTDINNPIPGRLMKLGIVLQLYNDNAAKGLKGIELPQGPISFDLELSSVYTPTSTSEHGGTVDTTETYTPLLWSYGENREVKYGEQNTDGRVLKDERGCLELAPYHEHVEEREGSDCRDSGTWNASQESNIIHITVDGYEIDLSHMPVRNQPDGTELYGANIGCFSSGAIWLVQPFNKTTTNTSPDGPEYDVIKDYGAGAFATTAEAKNLQATTVTGDKLIEGENGFQQMVTEDDREVRTLEINLPGAMQNRVRYAGSDKGSGSTEEGSRGWWTGSGVKDIYDGNDYATVGDGLYLKGGFSYAPNRVKENQLYLGTNLIRFYGSAIELKGDGRAVLEDGASLDGISGNGFNDWMNSGKIRKNIRIYYATKKDGKDWENDRELQHTYEKDLVFYDDLNKIPEGEVCVGILTCFVGPGAEPEEGRDDGYYSFYHEAQVRDDADLIGESFALVSTSRVWTKQMFEEADKSLEEIALNTDGEKNVEEWLLASGLLNTSHYKSANIEGSAWYTRETYKEDGSGAVGTHNSEWEHWGDTLLIIGYRTSITKNLLQKLPNGEEKQTFNLDSDQRVADFVLQPRTYYEKEGNYDHTTTVTVRDILPEYMTYKANSAYFGGKYQQNGAEGGKQGEIAADDSEDAVFKVPEQIEPDVEQNGDGTQTLTWVIKDVEVGKPMAPIYYSVDIGDKEKPEKEVPVGTTNLSNVAYIMAPEDLRDPVKTAEKNSKAGISVSRGTADSFGKYTKQKVVEEDGEIDYVVYFNNNAGQGGKVFVMDTMPMHQVNGSNFTGTYTFAKWSLDVEQCDVKKIKIYYTFDEKYKGMTTKNVTEEEVREWKEAEIDEASGKIAIPEPPKLEGEETHPIAWAVVGELGAGQKVSIDLKIQLDPGPSDKDKTENNYFVNLLSSGDTTTTTKTPTVRRILEGLTWIDDNRDGLQSEGEMKLSGVKVELLKLVEEDGKSVYKNVCYPGTEEPIVIETGQQISLRADGEDSVEAYKPGRYKFRDLPAGTFAVKFTEGTSKITILKATAENAGDDTIDSDGIPTYAGAMLEKTEIQAIKMPDAETMYQNSIKLYESKYNDSGFYCGADLGLTKKGLDGKLLANVRFRLTNSDGSIVRLGKTNGNGYFVIRETDDSAEWILTGDENQNYAFRRNNIQNGVQDLNLLDEMKAAYNGNFKAADVLDADKGYVETDGSGKLQVNGLLPGHYTVSEIQTAAGYQLLEKPIEIQLHPDRTVTLETMDDVEIDENGGLKVTNHPLYALPSTGGSGIYWYMFSGLLLMMAASLITYRKKCKGVLES